MTKTKTFLILGLGHGHPPSPSSEKLSEDYGHMLGPAKTYKLCLSKRSARTPTIKIVGGTGATKRGFVQ